MIELYFRVQPVLLVQTNLNLYAQKEETNSMSSEIDDTDSGSDSGSFVQTTSDTRQEISDHFNPILKPGSDHESDEEWVDPPGYESDDDEEQEELDHTFYANINQDRLNKPVNEWCSCGGCVTMASEQESVCCHESHFITPHRGEKKCITLVEMFTVNVVSKEGLDFGRYLYSMNIPDPVKKENFLKKKLTNKNYRFCAYRMFINMISCSDINRNVRYILPACVVSKIREKFPNLDGAPYTGYISLKTREGHSLP